MSEDLVQVLRIEGRDDASAELRAVVETLRAMERQATRTGKALAAAFGSDLGKRLDALKLGSEGFGEAVAESSARAAKGLRADATAAGELRDRLREVATEQRRMGAPPKVDLAPVVPSAIHPAAPAGAPQTPASPAPAAQPVPSRTAATARPTASADAFAPWRAKWRMRQASERADAADMRRKIAGGRYALAVRQRTERLARQAEAATLDRRLRNGRYLMAVRERSEKMAQREADRVAKAEATATTRKARADAVALDRRIRNMRYVDRVRERSEAAEMRHARALRREREATRRHALSAGRHAYNHGRHAVRSLNHPVHESLGFALAAGAAAGGAFAEHVVRASEAFDTSMSRLRMFAPQLDADAIRKQALGDSIALGIDASRIVDSIAKSVRDGVPAEIAQSLPKSIVQTAQVMGGDIERLTDSLAEGIQESTAMGWIKDKSDARRFLNLEAGLSTTAGNTSEKTEQFIAAGGLGHGKEMGLDLTNTMAYGAMLNASGARTGQASARFMGQLSQNTPKMADKYRQAVESHKNTEEDRAVRSAPRALGYGGIREMQSKIMAGPEGLIDFAVRLQKLDDKARKLVLEGYGFSEQGGAMLAELGSNGGAKGKAVLARAKELSEQKEANDYLSQKFAEWQKSLSFMLQQIEAGWRAIENEIGDVVKSDIIAPFRDWWVEISESIVHSDLKGELHRAITGFVQGLGFDDVGQLLHTLSGNAKGFDFAGFARGVGEGIRAVVDDLRSLCSVFGMGGSGLSAETVGRLATEFLELSLGLRLVAPVVSTIGGIASAFLALKAALEGATWLSKLAGLTGALEAAGGAAVEGGAMAGAGALALGLLPVTIAAIGVGTIAVAVMNWGEIASAWSDTVNHIRGLITGQPVERSRQDLAIQEGERQRAETLPDAQRRMPDQLGPDSFLPFADGGMIRGPGSGRSDSMLARVSNGEFVMNAAATARNLPLIQALNEGRKPPAFANGGMIGGRVDVSSLTAGSAAAGNVIVSASIGTERGFAGLRDRLDAIADLLRSDGRSSSLRHGEVAPVDSSAADAVRRLLAEIHAAALGLKPGSTTSNGSAAAAGGFGPGSGRPNIRFGRDGGAASPGKPNMRYGHGSDGKTRTTPGTGEAREVGPKVALGKMGAKFAQKAPVIMDGLMKKYGLTREQAAGIVGNLGHESAGFTAYHEGGQAAAKGGVGWAQWTGPRRRAFEAWTKSHGLNPTSDEASWRYLTEGDPETAGAIAKVKGTNNRRDATRAWHDAYERSADISHGRIVKPKNWNSRLSYADQAFAAQPGGATVEAGPSGSPSNPAPAGAAASAVDRALGMPNASAEQASAALGHVMHFKAWCADFVNANLAKAGLKGSGSAIASSFTGWGKHVALGDVQKGDVITENRHGDRVNHVGFATGQVQRDGNGNITAVQMVSGNYGNKVSTNWEKVSIISDLRRSNEAVAAAAAKVTRQSDEVAKQVPSNARPRPGQGDAAPVRDVTSDNSTVNNNHIHIHGAHDPHHVARTVVGHLDRMNSRYTDSGTFV